MADTQQLGVRIPADLYRDLKVMSERRGVPIAWIVVDAIKLHLARLNKQAG
ncbi:MAG: hypothetical protein KY464_06180 [Gemmatimonadetes bacterium]|nr:hypothetical protein [Gemmatimonadota bacterium]